MSKKRKKKTSVKSNTNKSKKSKKAPIILACASVIVIAVIALAVILNFSGSNDIKSGLCDNQWIASSAKNASGDEVEMAEVYKTNYSAYQGSLTFREDGSFSLWLSPGSADDGTHTGKYKLRSDEEIEAYFDDGTNTIFKVCEDNGKAVGVIVNYNDYEVYFTA